MGLRSHAYWAVANLAPYKFLFLGLGPRHQIRCCLHLAPSSVASVTQVVPPGSPTGPDSPPSPTLWQSQRRRAPSSESLAPSSYPPVPPCGSHWVKNTRDQNTLFPQGGEHEVLGSHQGSATRARLGHRGQLTQPLTSSVLARLFGHSFIC